MQKPPQQTSTTPHLSLNYAKLILAKVSFDATLFRRELHKAVNVLLPHEIKSLEQWCYRRFGDMYGSLLDECFSDPRMILT